MLSLPNETGEHRKMLTSQRIAPGRQKIGNNKTTAQEQGVSETGTSADGEGVVAMSERSQMWERFSVAPRLRNQSRGIFWGLLKDTWLHSIVTRSHR